MRIVSLLSSATEIIYLLGLEHALVGISHECDYPPEVRSHPRVSRVRFDPQGMDSARIDAEVRRSMELHGSVYEIDREMLRALRPDLVLTQAVCEVCAVPTGSVMDAIAELPSSPSVLSLDAHSIVDIIESVRRVAEAAGEAARGLAATAKLESRIAAVKDAVAARARPRVLMLEWLDPPFVPGHWVPEMIGYAGGVCLLGDAGVRSRQIEWSEAEGLSPDVLLVEPCGYDLARARSDADAAAGRLTSVAPDATNAGRAWLLDSAFYSRSGPRVVEGIETLAKIFHPASFPETVVHGKATRWP